MILNEMTRRQILDCPVRTDMFKHIACDHVVIVPTRKLHSGSKYSLMTLVYCCKDKPICKSVASSDIVSLLPYRVYENIWSDMIRQRDITTWRIECLAKSKLICLYTHRTIESNPPGSNADLQPYRRPN